MDTIVVLNPARIKQRTVQASKFLNNGDPLTGMAGGIAKFVKAGLGTRTDITKRTNSLELPLGDLLPGKYVVEYWAAFKVRGAVFV